MTPLWEPGSRTQYHGMTFGWILGEVLRRVDDADPERRFAFALTKNLLHPIVEGRVSTTRTIVEAVRQALGVEP